MKNGENGDILSGLSEEDLKTTKISSDQDHKNNEAIPLDNKEDLTHTEAVNLHQKLKRLNEAADDALSRSYSHNEHDGHIQGARKIKDELETQIEELWRKIDSDPKLKAEVDKVRQDDEIKNAQKQLEIANQEVIKLEEMYMSAKKYSDEQEIHDYNLDDTLKHEKELLDRAKDNKQHWESELERLSLRG